MARRSRKNKGGIDKKTLLTVIVVIAVIVLGYLYRDVLLDLYNDFMGDTDRAVDLDLDGKFAVHFIDVGQGDAILIQSPDNEFMLIDTGSGGYYNKLTGYLEHFKVDKFKYVE